MELKISAHGMDCTVPGHILVEMFGILLDNAVEAIKGTEYSQNVCVTISDSQREFYFAVSNEYQYVPYEELGKWFEAGQSRKGKLRGIGLYHLRTLCEEWKCDVIYKNQEADGRNRIEFMLRIPKMEYESGK